MTSEERIRSPWKRTMTRYGPCLSCAEGACVVHAGGNAASPAYSCTGGQHKKRCRAVHAKVPSSRPA